MTYRILSLDGGGAWALIEVRALMTIYDGDATGHDILSDFDLVAANSGGSLVLGGLIENLSLKDLLGYFEDVHKRKAVFSPTKSWGDRALQDLTGMGPKYSADAKLPAIQRLMPKMGNVPLSQATSGIRRAGSANDVHLLIIAFDYDRNRAKFFRSADAGSAPQPVTPGTPVWGLGESSEATVADAIHASSNAPVNYFDGPAKFPGQDGRYWDGALTGCNNPVLAAVTEAIVKGQKPDEIVALSLGTATVALPWPKAGQKPSPYLQPASDTGLVSDLHKLATAILDDPPDIATFLAHVMTGSGAGLPAALKSRIVRMNPLISPVLDAAGNWTAPETMSAAQFTYLAQLDMDAVEQNEVDAIDAYAALWLQSKAPNQPVRMDSDTLKPEIGDGWFQDALVNWSLLKKL